MSDNSKTPRFSQKERIFKVADKIIERLSIGMPFPRIQNALGLNDMPYTTFYRHARRLRDNTDLPPHLMPKNVADWKATGDNETGSAKPPKSSPSDESPAQRKSVVSVKVVKEEPRERVKRRRKGGGISPNLSVKKDEFDTSKWSSKI